MKSSYARQDVRSKKKDEPVELDCEQKNHFFFFFYRNKHNTSDIP